MADIHTTEAIHVEGDLHAHNIVQTITIGETTKTPDPPPKNVRFKVEKPIQTFIGRETFLEELHKVVKEGQNGEGGGVTVLTQDPLSVVAATGGIGKTETVRKYIQLHGHEYDHIIWIDAEDNSFAQRQFLQLATELKISTNFEGKQKGFESILKEIFGELLLNAHVVLLVFDNAEALEDDEELSLSGIKSLRPTSLSPFFVEPTIIVTSRNQNWNLQNVIHLDLWTEAEVVMFVFGRLELKNNSENESLALQLGSLFGRLPIALQAAVAVILQQTRRRKNYGIRSLIDEYESGSRKVLAQKPLDANMRPTQTRIPMLVLWNISLEKIIKFEDGALAIKILCFMSYMSPVRIPQDFLYALFQNDYSQDSFETAIVILEDYSLIASLSFDDSDSRSLTIHRMIQDSTIKNLRTRSNEGQTPHTIFSRNTFLNETKVLLKLSAESLKYLATFTTLTFSRRGELEETLVHITNHVSEKLDVEEFRDLTAGVAKALKETNNFTKSIELIERVLAATPAPCNDTEIVRKIELQEMLADSYGQKGHFQKSLDLYLQVLEGTINFVGPHHEKTLHTKCRVAFELYELKRFDEAIEMCHEALQGFENNEDTTSQLYLLAKTLYATFLSAKGEEKVASDLFTQVLEEQEKDPVSNSYITILTNGQIADQLGKEGHLEEASKIRLQNIEDATKLLGPFDLTTLGCKQSYATALFDQDKYDEAAPLLLKLLETQEIQIGPDHHQTLTTKVYLGSVYLATKELNKAEALLDVKVMERVLGLEHPVTLKVATDLSVVKQEQGKFGEALELSEKILKVRKNVLGPNHEDTLSTMHTIAVLYLKMKEYKKAAQFLGELLETQETQLGSDHSFILKAKFVLAQVYSATKKLDKAEVLLDVDVMERVLGSEHQATLQVAFLLSKVKEEQGKFKDALALLKKVLQVRKKVLAPNHEDTLNTMGTIGTMYYKMEEYEKAARLLRELIETQETQLGSDHSFILKAKIALAQVYLATKELDKAEVLLDVKLMERVFGPEHPDTLKAASVLSDVKEEQGKFKDALALHKKVLQVRKNVLGPNHEDTLNTMGKIGTLYYNMQEYEKAASLLRELLETQETQLGSDHSFILKAKFVLARVYLATKELEKAENLLEVEVMERVLGPEHPDTLKAATLLSEVKEEQRKFEDALALLQKSLQVRKNVLGPNHEDTLNTMGKIGTLYYNMQEYEKAASLLRELLETQETQLGSDHSFILKAKFVLARVYLATKELEKAENLLEVEVMERVLGPEHPDTLKAATLLSEVKEEQRKFEDALALLQKSLQVRKNVLGPNHEDTLNTMGKISTLYYKMEEYEKAASLLRELIETQETQLGSDHSFILKVKFSLAEVYLATKELDKAEAFFDFEVLENMFGPEHPDTLEAATLLSKVKEEEGKFQEALALHQKVLRVRKKVLGPNHKDTWNTMRQIVKLYAKLGEYKDAAEVAQEIFERQEEVLGKDNPNAIKALELLTLCRKLIDYQNNSTMNFMAVTSVDAETAEFFLRASDENLEVALDAFFDLNPNLQDTADLNLEGQALILSAAATDAENLNVATAFCNETEANEIQNLRLQPWGVPESNQPTTSNVLRLAGKKPRWGDFCVPGSAQDLYGFVDKKKQKKSPDSKSLRIFATKLYKASKLTDEGQLEKASKMQLQNIKDATKIFGLFHLVTLHCRHLYATGLFAQKKFDLAAGLLVELLETELTQLGSDHCYTLKTKFLLAKVYLKTKELDKSKALLDVNIMEEVYGPEHRETLKAAIFLSDLKEQQGKFEEALELSVKILNVRKKVLGPNHEATLGTMHTIGTLYVKLEEYEKAAPLLRELLETQENQLGADHRSTLKTKLILGIVFFATQELEKAEALLDVEVMEKVFGLEHPNTMEAATMLSLVKEQQRKFGEALELSKKVLQVRKNVLGPNHEFTLSTMHIISKLYYEMEEYEKAVEVAQELLERQEEAIGKDHSDAIKTLELLTLSRELFDHRNNFTMAFIALTSIDAETAKSFSEASNWNLKAALKAYRNSNPNALIGDQNNTSTLSETKTDAEIKNNLIREFMAMTGVNNETGRSFLQASDWNMEVALVSFFDSNSDEDNSDIDSEDDVLIPSAAATDAVNPNVIATFSNIAKVNQIQDDKVGVESVAESIPPTTLILFRLAGGKRLQGEFRVSSTVKDLYKFLNEMRQDFAESNYVLTMHPNTKLTQMEETLEEANLLNNVALTQRMLKE